MSTKILAVASSNSHLSRRQALLTSTTIPLVSSVGNPGRFTNAAMAASPNPSPAIERYQIPGTPLNISRVIKGCWQLSGGHTGDRDSDRTSGQNAVDDCYFFKTGGITTYDTADIYGPSEKILGQYLRKYPDAANETQIFTKFCCFGNSMNQAKDEQFVAKSIQNSMKNLGLSSLDCVQFYWHDYSNKNYKIAAQHLAMLQSQGKIKTIGVTNFDVPRLMEIVDEAGVDVRVNQVQYSLLDTRPENGMVDFCKERGIVLVPYGTVAGGFLSNKYLGKDPRAIAINTYSLSKYASIINQRGGWDWFQFLLQTLQEIGETHGVGIAEIASRWVLQKPTVAAIIIGARNAKHIKEHRKLFGFELSDENMKKIGSVLEQGRRPTSDVYSYERGGAVW